MEGIFREFENENGLRSYPFSAGCVLPDRNEFVIPDGVFVDASIYPVNSSGVVYLSKISEDGTFSISDSTGVIMTGTPSGNSVEFYDMSGLRRHSGTLVASSADALSDISGRGYDMEYLPENYAFVASCVFPVELGGVSSISVGGSDNVSGSVGFTNDKSDEVRVSSGTAGDGRKTIRFDVLPRPGNKEEGSIKRIVCVVDGQTPFRISKLSYNVVMLSLEGIDKASVCSAAHRENSLEMADTCECEQVPTSGYELPEAYDILEVYIPPDENGGNGGIQSGSENAFFLVSPNVTGYDNPISITLEDGVVSPRTDGIDVEINGTSAEIKDGELLDVVTSKGVVIQVPGLSGGAV
jgi:hypothetical protein